MSRIGRRPIMLPQGVTATVAANQVNLTGPKGELAVVYRPAVAVDLNGQTLVVKRSDDDRVARSLHGLTRVLLANAVRGVTEGFTVSLELVGIGYRAQTDGRTLTLNLGFTHPVVVTAPDGIVFRVEKNTLVHVDGIDKQRVGQVASEIRAVRPPEPYKGKGIRRLGEVVRLKPGKAAKTGK